MQPFKSYYTNTLIAESLNGNLSILDKQPKDIIETLRTNVRCNNSINALYKGINSNDDSSRLIHYCNMLSEDIYRFVTQKSANDPVKQQTYTNNFNNILQFLRSSPFNKYIFPDVVQSDTFIYLHRTDLLNQIAWPDKSEQEREQLLDGSFKFYVFFDDTSDKSEEIFKTLISYYVNNPTYFRHAKFNKAYGRNESFIFYFSSVGVKHTEEVKRYIQNLSFNLHTPIQTELNEDLKTVSGTQVKTCLLALRICLSMLGNNKQRIQELYNSFSHEKNSATVEVVKHHKADDIFTSKGIELIQKNTNLTLTGKQSSLTLPNNVQDITIGRKELSNIVDEPGYVGRAQFRLFKDANSSWNIQPYPNVTNHTLVNGERLTNTKRVKSHDKIEIGVEGTCVITLDGV
jgi:hypothetical protein